MIRSFAYRVLINSSSTTPLLICQKGSIINSTATSTSAYKRINNHYELNNIVNSRSIVIHSHNPTLCYYYTTTTTTDSKRNNKRGIGNRVFAILKYTKKNNNNNINNIIGYQKKEEEEEMADRVELYTKPVMNIDDVRKAYATPQYPGLSLPTLIESGEMFKQSDTGLIVECISTNVLKNMWEQEEEDEDGEVEQQQVVQGDAQQGQFNVSKYFRGLETIVFGKSLMYGKELSSTQQIMMEYLTYTAPGLVMLADGQSRARGRGNNTWTSADGCLMFSFKCKQADGNRLPFLQYLVGVALIRSIYSLVKELKVPVQLKWPNDIYLDGKKIGGILCQSNYYDHHFDVVVGVGLNVSNLHPTTSIIQHAVKEADTAVLTRENILSHFMNAFESMYLQFNKDGFHPFIPQYTESWMHTNQVVTLSAEHNQGKEIRVKVVGLAQNGYLEAVKCDESGNVLPTSERVELHPDGTSFDIANLTLKKKIQPQPK